MATYSAARAKHFTMTAAVVDTVTLAADYNSVRILNRGNGTIFVRADGVDPVVNGDNLDVIPPGQSLAVRTPGPTTEVRLISAEGTVATVIA
jgi:hypothetical protein